MSNNFRVEFKRSNGDLHVHPVGDFDGSSACELVNLLHEQYDGSGHVIIDTDRLREMCPFGCSTFHCRLDRQQVPPSQLCFRGDKGHRIAPNGSRVLPSLRKPTHHCSGNCANCKCRRQNGPDMIKEEKQTWQK